MSRWLLTLAAWPALAGAALAQPAPAKFDPDAAAKLLAPFVDAHTLAVARLDAARFDPAALAAHLAKAVPDAGAELDAMRWGMEAARGAFTRAGGREVYTVFELRDVRAPSFGVIPLAEGADAEALLKLAADFMPGGSAEKAGGVIVFGGDQAAKLALKRKPEARPEIARAFAAAGDGVAQLVVVPSADHRRVLDELMPTLPKEVGGGPVAALTRGLVWAAAGLDLGAKPTLTVTVQSADAESAKAFVGLLRKGFDHVGAQRIPGEEKSIRAIAPAEFDALVKLLTPEPKGDRVVVRLDGPPPALTGWLAKSVNSVRAAAARAQSLNNLKQVGIALHNYHDTNGRLPAQAICDRDGKPLLSWRVAILPYVEQDGLYKQFKLDEPWDSEHNKKLIARMPAIYASPAGKKLDGRTTYLAPVGKEMVFTGDPKGLKIPDIADGTSNTIFVVEGNDESAVTWTKPDDLRVDAKDPLKGLIGHYPQGFVAAFADGSVRFIAKTIDPKLLWALFTAKGNEAIGEID